MKTLGSLAFSLVIGSVCWAQPVPPALMVQEDGRSIPLGLARVQTEVRIFGAVAETTTTVTFANPLPRVMEGELYFPLPEGATISGYALDINGQMIDGVAVEKHKGRQVFEEVVRRGIDPGLVEWTKGNNFQTRVFPIPARGSRTVRVQYVAELAGSREAPAYHLPLNFKSKLPEFSLRVEVVKPAAPPQVKKGELANFTFGQWRESYVAETKLRDWSPIEDLVIALPKTEGPQLVVERADDGQVYFAVHDDPAEPKSEQAVATPKHVVLFWDASGSRAGNHAREIAVLSRYLAATLPQGPGGNEPTIAVDLVLVRNAASAPVRIEFSRSNPGRLSAHLEQVAYDGGTQLGAIGPLEGAARPDFYLLVTDGLSNFGRDEPARLDAPLYIFSAAATADHALLHSLAMTNGGRYFHLANWKDAEIAAQAGRSAWSYLSATAEGGEVADLYPQRAQPLSGRFTLVGKLAGDEATVAVRYGFQGGQSERRTFKVSRSEAVAGSLVRRLWAQKKLAELMIFQKRNEKEITALGRKFGLVTPYTSLIVLDSLEQYVEHEIAPPKSLGSMLEEYHRRIDTIEHQKKKQKADKLAQVVRMWNERVRWWNTEFKYAKDFKYRGETDGVAGSGRRLHMLAPARRAADAGAPEAPLAPGAKAERPMMLRPEAEAPAKSAEPAPAPRPAAPRADASPRLAPAESRPGGGERAEAKHDASGESGGRQPGIVIKPWNPDTPYLKDLKAAQAKSDRLAVYLKHRAQSGTTPAFFLDCADFFREEGDSALALQVLSNIAELQLEDASLLRVLGYRLLQIGELDLAVKTFEQVLEMRPEEPQSCRDLALTLARRAEQAQKDGSRPKDAVRDDYARAIDLFVRVVMTHWDQRFAEIELIALEEVNHLIPRAKAAGVSDIPLDPRLVKLLDVDVRIVMTWQADATDIDLWVTEPSGERAYYQHNRTTIGGLVSRDFTGGYGPEEYMVRRAAHGMYKIAANYYGSRATRLLGAITVQVEVFTNYGRETEQRKSLTLRLKDAKETVTVGEIEF